MPWRDARLTGRRLVARATPESKVAGYCAAQWPAFAPPLTILLEVLADKLALRRGRAPASVRS